MAWLSPERRIRAKSSLGCGSWLGRQPVSGGRNVEIGQDASGNAIVTGNNNLTVVLIF
jgi:hypothetical protein